MAASWVGEWSGRFAADGEEEEEDDDEDDGNMGEI